jgi:hypothetical protein
MSVPFMFREMVVVMDGFTVNRTAFSSRALAGLGIRVHSSYAASA